MTLLSSAYLERAQKLVFPDPWEPITEMVGWPDPAWEQTKWHNRYSDETVPAVRVWVQDIEGGRYEIVPPPRWLPSAAMLHNYQWPGRRENANPYMTIALARDLRALAVRLGLTVADADADAEAVAMEHFNQFGQFTTEASNALSYSEAIARRLYARKGLSFAGSSAEAIAAAGAAAQATQDAMKAADERASERGLISDLLMVGSVLATPFLAGYFAPAAVASPAAVDAAAAAAIVESGAGAVAFAEASEAIMLAEASGGALTTVGGVLAPTSAAVSATSSLLKEAAAFDEASEAIMLADASGGTLTTVGGALAPAAPAAAVSDPITSAATKAAKGAASSAAMTGLQQLARSLLAPSSPSSSSATAPAPGAGNLLLWIIGGLGVALALKG
jgi:hypothetical protein